MGNKGKPLISTEDDMPECKKSRGGCLSNILALIGFLLIISMVFRACSGGNSDESEEISNQSSSQQQEIGVDDASSAPADGEATAEDAQSPEAQSIENLLFHRLYTDLGTVQIHQFPERAKALEWMADNFTNEEAYNDIMSVKLENPLFGKSYYYITSEISDLYYMGETKDNRPDGFGAVVGLSTGDGSYALAGEALFYYVGNFKKGMMDGYGILFAADEADITYACQDAIQIMHDYGRDISEDTGEKLVIYLFDYVSYEGYFEKNEKEGKGNTFGFYWDEDVIRFIDILNPPIDNYLFGPVYPNVTMGEYENGKLSGKAKIYKSNRIVYEGHMKNGKESGTGITYYSNGQIEYEGELKNGKPHGTGTYYSSDGSVIYSGEWNNGDYAH